MIPLYLNDQLDAEQKKIFEKQLETNDHLKQELEEYSMIKQSYSDLGEELPSPSPDVFSRIMEKIRVEPEKEIEHASVIETIMEKIKPCLSAPRFAWSVAAVQMAAIIILVFCLPYETKFQTLSTTDPQLKSGVQINIVFQETAEEKKIRTLLNDLDATIINGPSKNGLYIIIIKDTRNKTHVLETLKASDLVKFAQSRY